MQTKFVKNIIFKQIYYCEIWCQECTCCVLLTIIFLVTVYFQFGNWSYNLFIWTCLNEILELYYSATPCYKGDTSISCLEAVIEVVLVLIHTFIILNLILLLVSQLYSSYTKCLWQVPSYLSQTWTYTKVEQTYL